MSWLLVQRSPTDCGASLCVIKKPHELGGHSPRWAAEPEREREKRLSCCIANKLWGTWFNYLTAVWSIA
jgi:hypothetical protein